MGMGERAETSGQWVAVAVEPLAVGDWFKPDTGGPEMEVVGFGKGVGIRRCEADDPQRIAFAARAAPAGAFVMFSTGGEHRREAVISSAELESLLGQLQRMTALDTARDTLVAKIDELEKRYEAATRRASRQFVRENAELFEALDKMDPSDGVAEVIDALNSVRERGQRDN
jgi:hypothetical protein